MARSWAERRSAQSQTDSRCTRRLGGPGRAGLGSRAVFCSISHHPLPLSICLSLSFSLSLCLFSPCKSSSADFHPTCLGINSNTFLSVKIFCFLTSPPFGNVCIFPTDCSSDNSQTSLSALTSLCVQPPRVPAGLQRREHRLQPGSLVSSARWAA